MGNRYVVLIIALSLGLLAGSLRLFHLGDWPFHGDELMSQGEVASLFEGVPQGADNPQGNRLPRLIPLSFLVLKIGYELFGTDEFGSRVVIALLGTLHVVLMFLLLDRPLGRVAAVSVALLLALWPEHLYRSQENRFYLTAAVFASLCMVAGAQAVQRRSYVWITLACLAAVAAVLAHTLEVVLMGGLFMAILVAAWLGKDRRLFRLLAVVGAGSVLAAAFVVCYVLPLARGWNAGEAWGYSGLHSLLAGVSQMGWPVVGLACLGALIAWQRGDEQDGYWLTWAALWAGAVLVLPFFVVYHPGYAFPLALGILVLAARAVAYVYESLRVHGNLAAVAWVGLAVALNLPGVASYYCDGSRYDFRSPARYIVKNWQPGDRVVSPSPNLLRHYMAGDAGPVVPMGGSDPLAKIKQLAGEPGRLWIVVTSPRSGKPETLRRWLGKNCSQQAVLCKKRFDYYEYVTEVYLYESPNGPDPMWAQGKD